MKDSYSLNRRRTDCIQVGPFEISKGDRVILRPHVSKHRGEAGLDGSIAVIIDIQRDRDERLYIAVQLECQPGSPFEYAAKAGHLFFLRTDEIEPVGNDSA